MSRHVRRRPRYAFVALPLLLAAAGVPLATVPTGETAHAAGPSMVSQFQPNVQWGGRAVSVSISATAPDVAIAASESGGLFRTSNNGTNWTHVDGLRPFRMSDVRIARNNTGIVLATTNGDSAVPYPGGIWRSNDGGTTWSVPTVPVPAGCTFARPNGWGIAFAPDPLSGNVYIGTDCGVAVSTNSGASWTMTDLPGGADDRAYAVVARLGGIVDVCARRGHFRSVDSGASFTQSASTNLPRGCLGTDVHAIDAHPTDPNVLWITVADTAGMYEIYESDDAGANWTDLNGTQAQFNRPPFVKAFAGTLPNTVNVFFGNGVNQYRQTCAGTTGTRCSVGTWTQVVSDHADMMEVSARPGTNCPTLMAGDGGIHRSGDCGLSWNIVGAGTGGYNALQVYEVNAQIHPGHTDYYFGTQDNDIWASSDSGATWAGRVQFEGFFITVPRTANDHTDVRVTGVACGPCNNFKSRQHFDMVEAWNSPDGPSPAANPFLIERNVYMQYSRPSPPNWQLNISTDQGVSWNAVPGLTITQALSSRPQVSGPPAEPTIYQPYARANGTAGLLKITGARTGGAQVTLADTGLGDIGNWCNGQGTFVCLNTFGVDPNDPNHVIAVDVAAGQMKVSRNGGASWQSDAELTNLVTMNGTRQFGSGDIFNGGTPTQARSVYFDPTNGNRILVGTENAGVIASLDDGQTWYRIPGSEQIPAVNAFVVDEARGDVVASSYGRGLWKLDFATADVSIVKSHSPEPATAGEPLRSTMFVSNAGPDTAPSVRVVDRLDPKTRYVAANVPCTVDSPPAGTGQTVECELGDLASGASTSIVIEMAVAADTVSTAGGTTSVSNTATVSSPGAFDPNLANNTDSDTAIVRDRADLAVTKICDSTVRAGQPARCTIHVDNQGPSDARAVQLTDRLTSNGQFTVQAATVEPAGGGTCTVPAGPTNDATVTCNLGTIQPATPQTVGRKTVVITFTGQEAQTVRDVASVRSATPDPINSNDTAESSLTITAAADLRVVSMSDTPDPVVAGQGLTFTVEVRNDGGSTAQNVRLGDNVPAGVTIDSVSTTSGTCTAGVPGDPFSPTTCNFGPLSSGASRTVPIQTTVLPGTTGSLHNDARVSSDTFDPDESNNLGHADTAVVVRPDLSVVVTGTPDPVVAGTELTFKNVVANAGPSTATQVALTHPISPLVTFRAATVSPGGGTCAYVDGANRVDCQLADLAPGEDVEVIIHVTVKPGDAEGASITGTSTVSSAGSELAPADNTGSDTVLVTRRSDLSIVLTSDADSYKPSTVIHYTVTTSNLGPSDAANVVVTQQLPPPKSGYYVSDTGGCTLSGTTLTCPRGTLAAGNVDSFVVKFFVQGSKGTMTSVASVTSSSTDPVSGNNSSTRVVTRK